ncbi:hypothetical protein HDR62_02825 [bacterium]|nr:hypothetical protein [bacterium]
MKTNLLTVWAKRAVPALALAGLTLTACEKENDKPIYRAPYEKELRFNDSNADSIDMPIVQKFARDTACKHIYLTVKDDNNFTTLDAETIRLIRDDLQSKIAISNKISGRGDFFFEKGVATVADSIWFVQNGWTIRQMANHR